MYQRRRRGQGGPGRLNNVISALNCCEMESNIDTFIDVSISDLSATPPTVAVSETVRDTNKSPIR